MGHGVTERVKADIVCCKIIKYFAPFVACYSVIQNLGTPVGIVIDLFHGQTGNCYCTVLQVRSNVLFKLCSMRPYQKR